MEPSGAERADTALAAQLDEVRASVENALRVLAEVGDLETLAAAREAALGANSPLARLSRSIRELPPAARPSIGAVVSEAREALRTAIDEAQRRIEVQLREQRFAQERSDPTVGLVEEGSLAPPGARHLVARARMELEDVFWRLGFEVASGPEVEDEWHNFEALNVPAYHPARAAQDSFYLDVVATPPLLLRTHTSPAQIRLMRRGRLPIYAVVPGRVYRRDTPDARHTPAFHQLEALVVDERISFADLKGTIEAFTTAYFGPAIHSRLRPAYFPFTEPSAEFEVTCTICQGAGCRTCSQTGWIELGGAGMVHPRVLEAGGLDPGRLSGFAFGFGIDRLVQMRYAIADMRILPENDLRFLAQTRSGA
jgi:phenylalanyl-tRNA synthetase alpha chain